MQIKIQNKNYPGMKTSYFDNLDWFHQTEKLEQQYDEFQQNERLQFFQVLMSLIGITSFSALIVFTIQEQSISMIVIMAIFSGFHLILMLFSSKISYWIKYFLPLLYLFYITTASIINVYGENEPQFLHGYSMGMLYTSIVQYCNPKTKIAFTLLTPWVFLILLNDLNIQNLPFIVINLSSSYLQGFIAYKFDKKQKSNFTYQRIIKKQQNIFNIITNERIFGISYDELLRTFQIEFQNNSFQSSYSEDIKDFLRSYVVLCDQEKTSQKRLFAKQITLEEYLYQQYKQEFDPENQTQNLLILKNKIDDHKIEIQVTQIFILHKIYIITIKSSIQNIQIEQYESKIKSLKQQMIVISIKLGKRFQQFYKEINLISSTTNLKAQNKIIQQQQSNIINTLNKINNILIYYKQQESLIQFSISELFSLQGFYNSIQFYCTTFSQQGKRCFISPQQQFFENFKMRLNQNLLGQIVVNIFHSIFNYSQINSTIRFTITNEDICNPFLQKLTQKSYSSKLEYLNSIDNIQNLVLQFTFFFVSNEPIENLEKILCNKIEFDESNMMEQIISSSVNYCILSQLGPYNQVFVKTHQDQVKQSILNEVTFYIYTDQTKLDPSYTKFIKYDNKLHF